MPTPFPDPMITGNSATTTVSGEAAAMTKKLSEVKKAARREERIGQS